MVLLWFGVKVFSRAQTGLVWSRGSRVPRVSFLHSGLSFTQLRTLGTTQTHKIVVGPNLPRGMKSLRLDAFTAVLVAQW